jgi:phage/plasmid-like protein (TIGR03299 family)
MAHELNFNAKRKTYSFVSNTEKAWHGLGTIVDHAMTSEEAIKLANLDFEVKQTSIHAQILDEQGNTIYSPYEEKVANYRSDNNEVLGLVGSRYEIIQNTDAFGFFDSIIDKGEAIFQTAGALGKGERIFITAKLPEDMLVGGEQCEKYIILSNSHNGSSAIVAGFTTVRIVCNNTLQAALGSMSNKVSIVHRKGAKNQLEQAHTLMGITSKYMLEVEELFNQMAKTPIADNNLKNYISDVMKPTYVALDEDKKDSTRFKNQVNDIYEFALGHPTQTTNAARGTVWGAYNSISGYYNHIKTYPSQEVKFKTQLYGTGSTIINKAFEKASLLLV